MAPLQSAAASYDITYRHIVTSNYKHPDSPEGSNQHNNIINASPVSPHLCNPDMDLTSSNQPSLGQCTHLPISGGCTAAAAAAVRTTKVRTANGVIVAFIKRFAITRPTSFTIGPDNAASDRKLMAPDNDGRDNATVADTL
ncbi:hypothetical protein JYU34_004840 [Plutella xylostella]|uniref:Uncharacterized protein n=1 Tax=Plutella xylostella TaxID=51655 RepID=A0ABQ7QVE5_PLUXY|nr:hypothetical protein JYU34_004840 [Plutella xylostella]